MQERWGSSVLHCPYCHGFELNQQPLGVLASSELAMHQAMLVPDWGPTTLFTQAAFTPNAEQEAQLIARGVQIEKTPIAELLGSKPGLEAPFSDPALVARYADTTPQRIPGFHDLHRMALILLSERAKSNARILALAAGGGLELK
uniref:Thioredoxin reductase n=1 Tax=Steinernema glaseri TaxID=37863 RepID=A0A1I7Y197_9BILA